MTTREKTFKCPRLVQSYHEFRYGASMAAPEAVLQIDVATEQPRGIICEDYEPTRKICWNKVKLPEMFQQGKGEYNVAVNKEADALAKAQGLRTPTSELIKKAEDAILEIREVFIEAHINSYRCVAQGGFKAL